MVWDGVWRTGAPADDVPVAEGDLAARTPGAQRATLPVAGAAPGSHPYRVEFVNAAGVTSSDTLTVRVTH